MMDSSVEIDIEEVKNRIRKRAALRRDRVDFTPIDLSLIHTHPLRPIHLSPLIQKELAQAVGLHSEFIPNEEGLYHVDDLLKFHDAEFVRNAYRALLKRTPHNDEGYWQNLEHLRGGRFDKIDILASLHSSKEGREKRVRVKGLAWPASLRRLSRLPVIGPLFSIISNLNDLSELSRAHQVSEQKLERIYVLVPAILETLAQLSEALTTLSEDVTRFSETQSKAVERLSETQNRLAGFHQQQVRALFREQKELIKEQRGLHEEIYVRPLELQEEVRRASEEGVARAEELTDFIEAEIRQLSEKLQQVRAQLSLEENRLTKFIERTESGTPSLKASERQPARTNNDGHRLDALYASLEMQFRGEGASVKERFEIYLPFFERARIRDGIVDIGCGSGDWLELLREMGFQAKGVETNSVLVKECKARALDVEEADMFDYLSRQQDATLRCVTAFHLVEHLPFETLIRFVDEILRVLEPGGLVILETPNPENLIVGGCNFYLDPTHQHPLPRALMKFLLEARGFHRLQILRLHPLDEMRVEGETPLTHRFNDHLYGPMDYAIVGWKA